MHVVVFGSVVVVVVAYHCFVYHKLRVFCESTTISKSPRPSTTKKNCWSVALYSRNKPQTSDHPYNRKRYSFWKCIREPSSHITCAQNAHRTKIYAPSKTVKRKRRDFEAMCSFKFHVKPHALGHFLESAHRQYYTQRSRLGDHAEMMMRERRFVRPRVAGDWRKSRRQLSGRRATHIYSVDHTVRAHWARYISALMEILIYLWKVTLK